MIVKAVVGNLLNEIENEHLDGVLNAANGRGPMGRGIAGAIKRIGGDEIQADAFRVCAEQDPQAGQAYSTISGSLKYKGVKRIIHAVTMKHPAAPTSVKTIGAVFASALKLAEKEGIKRIGCTALGTGVGGLEDDRVANEMFTIAQASPVEVVFFDYHPTFINTINDNLANVRQ